MQYNYDKTNFKSTYSKTNWGKLYYSENENEMNIFENRNKFIQEYNISRCVKPVLFTEKIKQKLVKIDKKLFQNIEVYCSKSPKSYIIISSIPDNFNINLNEVSNLGWEPINPMHSNEEFTLIQRISK